MWSSEKLSGAASKRPGQFGSRQWPPRKVQSRLPSRAIRDLSGSCRRPSEAIRKLSGVVQTGLELSGAIRKPSRAVQKPQTPPGSCPGLYLVISGNICVKPAQPSLQAQAARDSRPRSKPLKAVCQKQINYNVSQWIAMFFETFQAFFWTSILTNVHNQIKLKSVQALEQHKVI